MVYMMGYHIDLFGNYVDSQSLCEEAPESVTKFKCSMRGKSMMPYCSVSSHYDHTVDECRKHRPPIKVISQENNKKRNEANDFSPTKKWQPISSVFDDIE